MAECIKMAKGWFLKPDTMREDHSNGAWTWNNIQTVKGKIFDNAFLVYNSAR